MVTSKQARLIVESCCSCNSNFSAPPDLFARPGDHSQTVLLKGSNCNSWLVIIKSLIFLSSRHFSNRLRQKTWGFYCDYSWLLILVFQEFTWFSFSGLGVGFERFKLFMNISSFSSNITTYFQAFLPPGVSPLADCLQF